MSHVARVLTWSQDESELVTELQSGSGTAFDWLVTHYSGTVFSLVAGMISEPCDAADVTQDVFLKAFRGIQGFRRGSSLKTWLYRIAVREALNHRRWCWRHHRQQTSIDSEPADGRLPIEIEDNACSPFDSAASNEVQEAVRRALQEIPGIFRSAVILRDMEGMSYEEISEVLDLSAGTVKSRILRGRRLLKEILKPVLGISDISRAWEENLEASRQSGLDVRPDHQSEAVMHSTLFSPVEESSSKSSEEREWKNREEPCDAEGGV